MTPVEMGDRIDELERALEREKERVNLAYRQRNNAAIAMVKMALMLGWPTGRGIDSKVENDMEWRHVVYIDLPNGEQVSYHMAPDDVIHLEGLPEYRGKWDGKYTGTTTWHSMLPCQVDAASLMPLDDYAVSQLSPMALRRWLIEQSKLEADRDVSPGDRDRILLGYVKAWSR